MIGAEVGDAISRSRFSPHARREMTTTKGTQTSTQAASVAASACRSLTRLVPAVTDSFKETTGAKRNYYIQRLL
jgi:DNA topoisomerase IB